MKEESYQGYEVGPIRPPSEANSLMLRVTRNCPWNRCTFCSLYKQDKFSIRPVEHLLQDIDRIHTEIKAIKQVLSGPEDQYQQELIALQTGRSPSDQLSFHAAFNWLRGGMKSVFLQDANTMVMKPDDLAQVLCHLRSTFPRIERITSYARSQSIAQLSDAEVARLAEAGLNRIHIGMESGCSEVLDFVKKGADKQTHIVAGQRVKRAGIELSEYFMPGLGGAERSQANALETADAINQINPDFIRIRTLAIPENVALFGDWKSGTFTKLNDIQMAEELLLFLDNLQGITSTVKSDHILNLLQEVEGCLPEDKQQMTAPLRTFLALESDEQLLYLVGRRTGIFSSLTDLNDEELRHHAEKARKAYGVTWESAEDFTAEMMRRFI